MSGLDIGIEVPAGALQTSGRRLLAELVATPSESGEEAAVAERLCVFFRDHGREATVDAAGNVRAPADDAVLLTSHLDTVPGGPDVRVVEGDADLSAGGPVLHGRGSVDATGSLVAMAVAAVETGVSFAGVVQEETDSAGARYLLDDRSAPEAVVNGEPSGWDALTLGYRGIVAGEYTVETPSSHGARPEATAIDHGTAWWQRVLDTVDGDGGFDTVAVTATEMAGGLVPDGDSVEASFSVRARVPPDESPESVRSRLEGSLSHGSLDWGQEIPPHVGDPRSSVAGALRAGIRAEGGEPTHLKKTGTADSNLYAAEWGVPVATYGPGDSALDHAPDERLPLAEFDRAVAVLTTACEQLTD